MKKCFALITIILSMNVHAFEVKGTYTGTYDCVGYGGNYQEALADSKQKAEELATSRARHICAPQEALRDSEFLIEKDYKTFHVPWSCYSRMTTQAAAEFVCR